MTKAAFTLKVLMHRSDLLTISDFFGPSVYIHFRHDWYPIYVFTLRIDCSDRFTMHMVDPRVLNGRAIKIIYIIHIEWPLLFARLDNGCHGCFAAQNLTEQIKTGK